MKRRVRKNKNSSPIRMSTRAKSETRNKLFRHRGRVLLELLIVPQSLAVSATMPMPSSSHRVDRDPHEFRCSVVHVGRGSNSFFSRSPHGNAPVPSFTTTSASPVPLGSPCPSESSRRGLGNSALKPSCCTPLENAIVPGPLELTGKNTSAGLSSQHLTSIGVSADTHVVTSGRPANIMERFNALEQSSRTKKVKRRQV